MNRDSLSLVGSMLAAAVYLAGCSAQQAPFKFHGDGELAHYNKVATEIEYPNIADCPSDAAITCPSPEVIGPDSQPTYWDLKLEEAMQLGLAKSKVLHDLGGTVLQRPTNARTIADPAIVDTDPRYGVEAALSEFDTVFNSRVDYQRNHRFVNNVFFGGGTRELLQDTDVFRSELTKTAATGSTFTFAHNTVYDHNNSPGNLFGSSWDTNFEASMRQPLLQGAGVEYNRIAGPKGSPGNLNGVLLARINTDISLADFEIGLRDLVSNIENAYWDLYFAYRDLDAKITARDNALESWRKTHALFQAGRRGGEAEKEAESREQYFHFQEEVQNAWSGRLVEGTQSNNGSGGGTLRGTGGVRVAERRLRFLIGLPSSDGRLIRPADEPSLAKVVFNWDEVLPEAVNRRPELRRQRWAIKRGELALIASRNFLLPKLDAFGLYRIRGFGRDLKDGMDNTPENSAFDDLTSGRHQEWEVGMELSVPLGERQGHAAVRNAQLLLSRERAVLDDQEREAVLDVSNAMAEVDRAYQVAQTAYNRRMAAKADVASTRAAYESDKAPLDLYLEAQRRIADAETNFFATLVEYALAIKNLHYVKGSLLDYNEVYLSEGPWPGKAYNDAAYRQPSRWQPHALNYIFHQPPPVSQGTEPNYPLPPPAGPLGPPPGPGQLPIQQPEEVPAKPSQPQTGATTTTDKRSAPPGTLLRAVTAQPASPPAQPPKWTIPYVPPQSPTPAISGSRERTAPPVGEASQANSIPHWIIPSPSAVPSPSTGPSKTTARPSDSQSAERVANIVRFPAPTTWAPTDSEKTPPQSPLRFATDLAKTASPTAPQPVTNPVRTPSPTAAPQWATAPSPTTGPDSSNPRLSVPSQTTVFRRSEPQDTLPSNDRQPAGATQSSNLNWLPPQNKAAAVERWPIPASSAPSLPPAAESHPPTARSTSAETPSESIFVSSAHQQPTRPLFGAQSASWPESAMRPLPPVGNNSSYFVDPAASNKNYVRPIAYPDSRGVNFQAPPTTEGQSMRTVQPTSYTAAVNNSSAANYSAAPSDPQRPAIRQPLPPTSTTQPLPPTSSIQSLPPTPQVQPLPPIGP